MTALKSIPLLPVLVALLIGLLVVFLAVGGFDDPAWVDRFFGPTEKFRVLEFLGVAMGGVLLAIGAVIAHKRAVALEDAAKAQARAAEAQADAAKRQADANKGAEDGRRQERLKTAIEHLGHASDSVRLGGAYELFHLAKDTEDLRQTVLDILCAHIRRTTGEAEYRERYKSKPSEEIQSLLTLLFVQEHDVFMALPINLQGSWLNGIDIANGRLQRANLIGAQLQEALLIGAQMQDANLDGSLMQKINLGMAQMQEASLIGAQMQGATLVGVQMQGARLLLAKMQGANLRSVKIQGANLTMVEMQGAKLDQALMQGVDLYQAKMQGTYLHKTQMQEANFRETQMQGAGRQEDWPLFLEPIVMSIGRKTNLSEAVIQGGLDRDSVNSLIVDLSDKKAKMLRETLESHIGKPVSHELPENSGAVTGAYTEEEAERWIAEYEKATGESPKAGKG